MEEDIIKSVQAEAIRQAQAEERKWLGEYLQGIVDDWRCNSTEIWRIAEFLKKGERPSYDINQFRT